MRICLLTIDKAAYSFTSVVNAVREMLEDITLQLPIIDEYKSLYPQAHALNEPYMALYAEYVGVCIEAVLFFKSRFGSRWR